MFRANPRKLSIITEGEAGVKKFKLIEQCNLLNLLPVPPGVFYRLEFWSGGFFRHNFLAFSFFRSSEGRKMIMGVVVQ